MFQHRLKTARQAKKLTLEELAKLYNEKFDGKLNKGTLSKYENGRQEPMINVVANLANLLEVSIDYLSGITDDPNVNSAQKNNLSATAKEVIEKELINTGVFPEDKDLTDEEYKNILELLKVHFKGRT